MTPNKRYQFEWYAGASIFVAFIGAHFMFGAKAAVQVLGAACVVTGMVWIFRRSIPFGIEARAPSFYLKGWGAILGGLAMIASGVILLSYAAIVMCMLGWHCLLNALEIKVAKKIFKNNEKFSWGE
jgi:hypothetical protein